MDTAAIVQWFQQVFGSFDFNILQFYNNLHEGPLGGILDVFFLVYTHLGDDGILFIVLGLIFLLFKKTRKVGAGMLIGIAVGALITNITIKPLIARPRPFELFEYINNDPNVLLFKDWWESMGSVSASSMRSFPSGHTTSAVAALVPVFLFCNKKTSWLALVAAVLMGASRNYVMVHYPSDVLGGIIVGLIAGIAAFIIVSVVMKKIENTKVGQFDLAAVIKAKKAK